MRRTTTHSRLASAALLFAAHAVAADNLACNGTGMKWYTDMVGETPCQTYQKLRQICNAQYAVGVQNVNTPPDSCSDQVSTCCCNTIAFSLSMLCLNCQQDIGTGTGLDAGVGAYQDYLGQCGSPQNFKLPTDIQTAVCNEKIKIDDDIYTNGWQDGSWFYIFTRDTITKDNIVANNNSFTHCPSTTVNATSSAGSSSASASFSSTPKPNSSSPSSSNSSSTPISSKKLATGAVAGIAVAAVLLGLGAAFALWWFCFHRRRHGGSEMRAGVLEKPLGAGGSGVWGGGGGMRERERERGRDGREVDESLVARGYPYTSEEPATTTSDYFPATRSDGGTSSSAPGFAGLGAGSAAGIGMGYTYTHAGNGAGAGGAYPYPYPYDTPSESTTPRRGLHTSGQPSTSTLGTQAGAGGEVASASLSGSSGRQEGRRGQAGPLPRKRGGNSNANANTATTPPAPRRAPSAEPFLENEQEHEREGWLEAETGSDRHLDAGPVSNVSLGRSPSGRLPPAYGEQI